MPLQGLGSKFESLNDKIPFWFFFKLFILFYFFLLAKCWDQSQCNLSSERLVRYNEIVSIYMMQVGKCAPHPLLRRLFSCSLRKMAPITTYAANRRGNERRECCKFLCILVWAIKVHLCFIGAVKQSYARIARDKTCALGGGRRGTLKQGDSEVRTEFNAADFSSFMCRWFWVSTATSGSRKNFSPQSAH